ncbi:ssDNA endonuclease and repair protein rad10 [Rhodotorula kratochvilovae]
MLNSILVNTRQKGNPIIESIRNVPWEYGDIKIRYHLLHPEYIHTRIADLGQNYNLRIILVQCDADNHTAAMKELTKVALVNGYTLMTCWTSQEAGRYLEAYKQFERKPPDLIRERTDASYTAHMAAALTEVRGVNKTDVTTLMSSLGTFAKIVTAPASQLSTLPGLGDKKVRRLREAFTAPFVVGAKRRRTGPGEAEKRGEGGERVLN